MVTSWNIENTQHQQKCSEETRIVETNSENKFHKNLTNGQENAMWMQFYWIGMITVAIFPIDNKKYFNYLSRREDAFPHLHLGFQQLIWIIYYIGMNDLWLFNVYAAYDIKSRQIK